MQPVIKICCIKSIAEAEMALTAGAGAIGLVSAMPSGPGVIDETEISRITAALPASINTFLLTSLTTTLEIIAQHSRCKTTTIQICDELTGGSYTDLRRALPNINLIQVLHVAGENTITTAIEIAHEVDGLLLDSGNPDKEIKELGGTGRVHNWDISRAICQVVDVPVFLAGGLNQHNVTKAIEIVKPYGVDICTGVRTDGKLDQQKLNGLINAIKINRGGET